MASAPSEGPVVNATHIGHLGVRYRVRGGRPAAARVQGRLDRLLPAALPRALAQALDRALAGDPRVLCLRRVHHRAGLQIRDTTSDEELARRWGTSIAKTLLAHLLHLDGAGSSRVEGVVFSNPGELVARFLVDLVAGNAWEKWFYAPFAPLRSLSVSGAVAQALVEAGEHRGEALAHLHRAGALERTLAALGDAGAVEVWEAGTTLRTIAAQGARKTRAEETRTGQDATTATGDLSGDPVGSGDESSLPWRLQPADPSSSPLAPDVASRIEVLRPLLTAALTVMQGVGLRTPTGSISKALVEAFLASDPPDADWDDPASLADVVAHGVAFLVQEVTFEDPGASRPTADRLEAATAGLDWLDVPRLRRALTGILTSPATPESETNLSPPAPPRASQATPRQLELVADLQRVLGSVRLDPRTPDSPANALRLYAALLDHAPAWNGVPLLRMVRPWIDRLLLAWRHLRDELSRRDTGEERDLETFLSLSLATSPSCRALRPLGEPVQSLLLQLLQSSDGLAAGPSSRDSASVLGSGPTGHPRQSPDLVPGTVEEVHSPGTVGQVPGTVEEVHSPGTLGQVPGTVEEVHSPGTVGQVPGTVEEVHSPGTVGRRRRGIGHAVSTRAWASPGRAGPVVPPPETAADGLATACAGLFLLARTLSDLRLAVPVREATELGEFPPLRDLLLTLGLSLARDDGLRGQGLDPGLALLAGEDADSPHARLGELRRAWRPTTRDQHRRFQASLFEVLSGQRLLADGALHAFALTRDHGEMAVAGCPAFAAAPGQATASHLWPLGEVLDPAPDAGARAAVLDGWLHTWSSTRGEPPARVVTTGELAPSTSHVDGVPVVVPSRQTAPETDETDETRETTAAHFAIEAALTRALEDLASPLGLPQSDLTVALTATVVVRAWARWLPRLATSSVPYLLENFLRRRGRIHARPGEIVVEMEPGAMDVVLEMSSYLAPLENVPWLGHRRLSYRLLPNP